MTSLSETEAATLLNSALQIVCTLDAACIEEKPWHAPLPRGLLTCGEAITLIPALAMILSEMYPKLMMPEYMHNTLELAMLDQTEGEA